MWTTCGLKVSRTRHPIGSEPISTKFSGCWSSCFAVTGAMCTDFRTALHWVLWLFDDLDVGAPLDC
jgi:hypothetical protein